MKNCIWSLALLLLFSCNNNRPAEQVIAEKPVAEKKQSFFPVTSYLRGQVFEIKEKGVMPVKYTTVNEHTDSVSINFNDLDSLVKEFLIPEIDTANLEPFFKENRFLDQSVNAFTFTYDPKTKLPDSLALKHWDVYIDPENNKVTRVYLVKKADKNTTLQLTWQSNRWFKTTTIVSGTDGKEKIEKEIKISWDY